MDMQKIIEKRLRNYSTNALLDTKTNQSVCVGDRIYRLPDSMIRNLAKQIASDIQKEWKVIARGEVRMLPNLGEYMVGDSDNDETIILKILHYQGKEIEIAVRIIDETKE
jgi:hypothetical protein